MTREELYNKLMALKKNPMAVIPHKWLMVIHALLFAELSRECVVYFVGQPIHAWVATFSALGIAYYLGRKDQRGIDEANRRKSTKG